MNEFSYNAFIFKQRADGCGPYFGLFYAPAGEVSAWSDVDRLGPENKLAPQREPRQSRISSIKRFFATDSENTIPAAIVIGLRGVEVDKTKTYTSINIRVGADKFKPGLIIDGQHRLRGLEAADPRTLVPVVAIIDASDLEMAFQFLVINSKSARVPPDHLRALALNYPEDVLGSRLKGARLSLNANLGSVGVLDDDPESPFRGMVDWPNNPPEQRIIAPAAIEAMASEVKSLGFGEIDHADSINGFLIALWSTVKEEWPHLFKQGSKLMSKVGLICMTSFICSTIKTWHRNPRLRNQVDPGNPESVRAITLDVISALTPRFFEAEWASASYDTRAGRDQIINDLEMISSNLVNSEPWYEGLMVVDSNWLRTNEAD